MALPKKNFRTITVNGEQFIWKVRKKMNWNEETGGDLQIPIRYASGGQLLLVQSGYCRSTIRYEAYGIPNKVSAILPSFIKRCINKAINQGWQYKLEGKPLTINCEELA